MIVALPDSTCMPGWVSFNGHCYLLDNATYSNYTEAELYCQKHHAHLAHVNNMLENAFLVAQFPLADGSKQHRMWIGLNDMQSEGLYEWTDMWPVTFTSWRLNQPDDARHSEDCVELYVQPSDRLSSGVWNDRLCGSKQGFICETRPGCSQSVLLAYRNLLSNYLYSRYSNTNKVTNLYSC